MDDLPTPRTTDHRYMAGVCERLDRQNELLANILDRLPASNGGQPEPGGERPGEVEITEPAVPPAPGDAEPLAEPAAPPTRPPAKKPAKAPAKTDTKTGTKTSRARAAGRARTTSKKGTS